MATKPVYYVSLFSQSGKKPSAKVASRFKSVIKGFNAEIIQEHNTISAKFFEEDLAMRCGLALNAAVAFDKIFAGTVTCTVQDQPRSKYHYLIDFHKF